MASALFLLGLLLHVAFIVWCIFDARRLSKAGLRVNAFLVFSCLIIGELLLLAITSVPFISHIGNTEWAKAAIVLVNLAILGIVYAVWKFNRLHASSPESLTPSAILRKNCFAFLGQLLTFLLLIYLTNISGGIALLLTYIAYPLIGIYGLILNSKLWGTKYRLVAIPFFIVSVAFATVFPAIFFMQYFFK